MYKIIDSKTLEIGSKLIQLPCSLSSTSDKKGVFIVEYDGLIIANLYPETKEDIEDAKSNHFNMARNIWAFDQDGNKVWEVQAAPPTNNGLATYLSVFIEGDNLSAWNWDSFYYKINPQDGTITALREGR